MGLLTFDYDHSLPMDVKDTAPVENRGGLTVREISFAGGADRRVEATLVAPGGNGPFAAILWVHWFEPESTTSNRSQFREEAVALASSGVVSLLVDGLWTMTPKKWAESQKFFWRTEPKHDTEVSIGQVIDLRRALDFLLAQPGVEAERVGYVGHDFGAMYGSLVAAVDKRVKCYVLMAGTVTFSEWFQFGTKLDKAQMETYIEAMRPLDPVRYIGKAAPAALFFQFAHADYYIPERTAQMFFDAASQPKDIAWYEAQHDLGHDEARPDRIKWLRKQLQI